jgi:catechol 2,3-dioxygenase-like lactoylglutathione lyase family enzyme
MTTRIHVHLLATDINRSAAFYERLFGAPVKVKPGYRKFLPAFAPLNLALSQHGEGPAGRQAVSHLGVQFSTAGEVAAHLARAKAAGLTLREERGVSCCHANQDKFWSTDPDGNEWEFYAINFDIEDAEAPASPTADRRPIRVARRRPRRVWRLMPAAWARWRTGS